MITRCNVLTQGDQCTKIYYAYGDGHMRRIRSPHKYTMHITITLIGVQCDDGYGVIILFACDCVRVLVAWFWVRW